VGIEAGATFCSTSRTAFSGRFGSMRPAIPTSSWAAASCWAASKLGMAFMTFAIVRACRTDTTPASAAS